MRRVIIPVGIVKTENKLRNCQLSISSVTCTNQSL